MVWAHRIDLATRKLSGCVRQIAECEENAVTDEASNRRIWRRLAAEARGDALYWAVELWIAAPREPLSLPET